MFRAAIDTGGTFTDVTAVNTAGQTVMIKTLTNREDPAAGIIAGLSEAAAAWGLDLKGFLAQTDQIVHGTTLALNALLEKKGARTALLTTDGFRDALEIRRSRRENQWDMRAPVPPVLVPRRLRLGIRERVNYQGEVITPLDREQLREAASFLLGEGIDSIAVCFLFSFQNPAHELEAVTMLRDLLPGVYVTASSELAPRIREYERTSTTVLNAYLTPVLARYLEALEARLGAYGWHKPINLMLNSGGLSDVLAVRNCAVRTLLSGPAGGARGGMILGHGLKRQHLVIADMGGTSFDVTLVADGTSRLAPEAEIAGYPVTLPVTDIHSIGAGGGSIASVDGSGRLLLGPRSAGSMPGPACYGQGGLEPTVTDAALILGIINPDGFLGGRLKLDCEKAYTAFNHCLAEPLHITAEEAALAVYRVAAAKMADAVRLVTVRQGLDPRQFTLTAAGGAFPLFAGLIAEELEMSEVLIPIQGPVFCAWGMLGATCQHDAVRSCLMTKPAWDGEKLNEMVLEMLRESDAELDRMGVSETERETEIALEMKYTGQHHEISIVYKDTHFTDLSAAVIDEAFHQQHQRLYGYNEPAKPWEIVNLRTIRRQRTKAPVLPGWENTEPQQEEARGVLLDATGRCQVRVYKSGYLPPEVKGPALVEFPFTTLVVPAGFTAGVEQQGYILMRREVAASEG